MSNDTQGYLPRAVAEQRLGRALFGDEWVEALTVRETWLLEEGGRSSRLRNEPAIILPGGLTIDASVSPAFSLDQQQYGTARHRQTFMQWQRQQVEDWLIERRLLSEDGLRVSSVEFEAAIPAATLPAQPPPQHKRKGGNAAFDDAEIVREVRQAVLTRSAKSRAEAAQQRLDRISGNGTPESKIARIVKKARSTDQS